EPYPTHVERTHTIVEALADYEQQPPADPHTAHGAYTLTGRLRAIRPMGKASFAHIEDGSSKLQLYLRADELGAEKYNLFVDNFDLGDFIQASGGLFKTKTGETTLRVQDFKMLAKAVGPLPAAKEEVVDGKKIIHSAFDNPEARYRERYADLAVNPEIREVFRARAKICAVIRRFLDEHGFLEVETPILQPLYGGAAARPFTTHHNQLHQDLYLRISFELYLKRLLVGMYDAVYEIGRDFRNEGVSFKHNPEFTMLEFYKAYIDYKGVMALTEAMVADAAEKVTGSSKISYQGQEINLAAPWPRMTVRESIKAKAEIDY